MNGVHRSATGNFLLQDIYLHHLEHVEVAGAL
jgi:hypothetical protein